MSISKQFLTAGEAIFTVEVPEEHRKEGVKPHYTYRVDKVEQNAKYPEAYFVKLLSGPDNTSDYSYVGRLDQFVGFVETTAKSKFTHESYPVKLLNRVVARVWCDDHAAYEQYGFKVHHEGKCGRCGRRLTVPESVESGIGPECAKKL